ncbi:hypothetical protein V9R59_002424 [Vibrio harveyi]|jgi:hypothetical protein|uniref:Uncharacterized protein n=1 Tax=Vibrio harveyi TaxID=669 RepID=A0A8B3E8L4_VIBHA|nr:hypothetical protein [Vibrio harveyi]AWB00628.1 hypothetical protein CU052_15625 [Vibrio harveyi]EKO3786277.1 hypothetical protein [Vibrio harveyi]RIW09390.1 hypothetical protein DS957_018575 [Vibrio harveyi]HDM8214504.1 hypothetical protein [Vibrio harveyi]
MEILDYQMDDASIHALKRIVGLECKLMTSFDNTCLESDPVTSLSPLFFQMPTGFVELTNEWHTSPQGHDFHLPVARFVDELNPQEVKLTQLEGVRFCEESKVIECIDVIRLRSRKAVKENLADKAFVPSSEVVIYDYGLNIMFVDGTCIAVKTEDDSILGEWLISNEAIEPYHLEDVYQETLEIRSRIRA